MSQIISRMEFFGTFIIFKIGFLSQILTAKGHLKDSLTGNGEIFEDGGPDGRLGNDFQDEVPSFPSIDRQVPSSSISHPDSYYLAFEIIGIIWPRMQSECTLYKSSKAGLCLDLMILSKLSKACQNFCQTN